jgi:hypothetical protein
VGTSISLFEVPEVQLNKQINKKNKFSSNSTTYYQIKKYIVDVFRGGAWWFWSLKESVVIGIFLLDGFRY